jgi:hypothetical protein
MNSLVTGYRKTHTDARFHLLSVAFFLLAVIPLIFILLSSTNVESYMQWIVVGYCLISIAMGTVMGLSLQINRSIGLLAVFVGQLFWFSIPALSVITGPDSFGDKLNYYLPDHIIVLTTAYLSLFTITLLVAYWLFNVRFGMAVAAQLRNRSSQSYLPDNYLFWFVVVLAVVGLLPFITSGASPTAIVGGILGSRSGGKAWHSSLENVNPLYVLGRGCFATAGQLALFYTFRTQSFQKRAIWAFIFLLSFIITYFDSGTRSWTLLIIGPPVLLLLRNSLLKRKFNRWLIAGPLLVFCMLWLVSFQAKFRGSGVNADVLASASDVQLDDNDFFSETAVAISLVPDRMDYLRESTLFLFLVNPIPRALWSGKPYPRVVEMYGIGRTGIDEYLTRGNSRMPSVVGQYYMNWGLWGIFVAAIFYGVVTAICDALLRREGPARLSHIWAATVVIWLFVSYRGLFPGFHYPFVIIGLLILYEKLSARIRTRGQSLPSASLLRAGADWRTRQ